MSGVSPKVRPEGAARTLFQLLLNEPPARARLPNAKHRVRANSDDPLFLFANQLTWTCRPVIIYAVNIENIVCPANIEDKLESRHGATAA